MDTSNISKALCKVWRCAVQHGLRCCRGRFEQAWRHHPIVRTLAGYSPTHVEPDSGIKLHAVALVHTNPLLPLAIHTVVSRACDINPHDIGWFRAEPAAVHGGFVTSLSPRSGTATCSKELVEKRKTRQF